VLGECLGNRMLVLVLGFVFLALIVPLAALARALDRARDAGECLFQGAHVLAIGGVVPAR
jgi:hypothetical protein